MARLYPLLCTLLVTGLLAACEPVDFTDNDGNSGRFADYQGQWILINYWAVWCKPCIEEIPELNQFAAQQRGKVKVFGVDFDQSSGEKLQQRIDALGIQFPLLMSDPSTVLGFPRPTVLPTTLLIDPQGKIHKTLHGPQTRDSLLDAIHH